MGKFTNKTVDGAKRLFALLVVLILLFSFLAHMFATNFGRVLFSAVTVTAGEDEIELLVGGIPREYDDLEGWSEFDDLMCFISEETEVSVRAEAYLYGEGDSMRASPEEIDDLMQRMKDDTGFLNRCCSNLESVNFTFVWSPEELFGMPFGQMLM